jgi:hypothetical protein
MKNKVQHIFILGITGILFITAFIILIYIIGKAFFISQVSVLEPSKIHYAVYPSKQYSDIYINADNEICAAYLSNNDFYEDRFSEDAGRFVITSSAVFPCTAKNGSPFIELTMSNKYAVVTQTTSNNQKQILLSYFSNNIILSDQFLISDLFLTDDGVFYARLDNNKYRIAFYSFVNSSRNTYPTLKNVKGHFYNPYYWEKYNTVTFNATVYSSSDNDNRPYKHYIYMKKGNNDFISLPVGFSVNKQLLRTKMQGSSDGTFFSYMSPEDTSNSITTFNMKYYPFSVADLGSKKNDVFKLGFNIKLDTLKYIHSFCYDSKNPLKLYVIGVPLNSFKFGIFEIPLKVKLLRNGLSTIDIIILCCLCCIIFLILKYILYYKTLYVRSKRK